MLGALLLTIAIAGCGGGGGSGGSPAAPTVIPTVTLSGNLILPDSMNRDLLASLALASSTDSLIRNPLANPSLGRATVNRGDVSYPLTVSANNLAFSISDVPEAALYRIDLFFGRVRFKAHTTATAAIVIDTRSTAAAMLAETAALSAAGANAATMLASYPAQVTQLAGQLDQLLRADTDAIGTDPLATAPLTMAVASVAELISANPIVTPGARLAWLVLGDNDLDGDRRPDFRVVRGSSGASYHLEPTIDNRLAQATGPVTGLDFVDDARLRQYQPADGLYTWIMPTDSNLGFWGRLKYGRTEDTFIRLWVRRIDAVEGVFRGMAIEYQLVNGSGTAITTGSKVLRNRGLAPGAGQVTATDFVTDGAATEPFRLSYGSGSIGAADGVTPLVRFREGVGNLGITLATTYSTDPLFGYQPTTAAALRVVDDTLTLRVGQVFEACFPNTMTYALFQIRQIDTVNQTVTIDYKVNRAGYDPRF